MRFLTSAVSRQNEWLARESGQSMVDYAMVTALVIAAVAIAYQFVELDQLVQTIFNNVTDALG